jgi:hypothetical protein
MSLRLCSLSALLLSTAATLILDMRANANETIDVFLIGGQSNADGRALASGLPASLQQPQSNVPFYYGTGSTVTSLQPESFGLINQGATQDFGPEVTFGYSMANYYSGQANTEVAVIKYAAGGTNLYSQWAAGGTATEAGDGSVYDNFQNAVTNGLKAIAKANPTATIKIDGMVWMQGESDATIVNGVDESLQYQTELTNFIGDIRLTYGANLPFVIGELSSKQTGTGATAQRNNVRAAQVAVGSTLPDTAVVNTDTFPLNSDALHFSTVGQEDLGYGFATDLQSFLPIPEPSSAPLLAFGIAFLGFCGWRARCRR